MRAFDARAVALVPQGTVEGTPNGAWRLGTRRSFDRVVVATRSAGRSVVRDLVDVGSLAPEVDAAAWREAFARPGATDGLPVIMGVVNVTPDSFSDGGLWLDPDRAVRHGLALVAEGAAILDVGGESTRPGAEPVGVAEEIARVEPVIRALAAAGHVVSIDTRNAATMEAALDAGARIVNDVSALTHDARALDVVARAGCEVVLMHAQGDPRTMQQDPRYDDAPLDVLDMLAARVAACAAAGIPLELITVDPGIGFGKTLQHNLQILRDLAMYRGLGCRVLLGASRKSFIGRLAGTATLPSPAERVPGSLAAAIAGWRAGVDVVRVHDVAATRQALRVAAAIERGEPV